MSGSKVIVKAKKENDVIDFGFGMSETLSRDVFDVSKNVSMIGTEGELSIGEIIIKFNSIFYLIL